MSRDFMEDYLQHSWGKKPEQKAREKEYNKEYYQKHKDKWKKYDSWLHDSNAPNRRASEAAAANERAKAEQNMANQDFLRRSSRKHSTTGTTGGVKSAITTAGKLAYASNIAGQKAVRLAVSPGVYAGAAAADSIKLGKKFVSKLLDKIF